MLINEIKIKDEIMKCYRLKNKYERQQNYYNGLCMFIYSDNFEEGEWGNYKKSKRNGFVLTWDKKIGCTRANYINEVIEGEVLRNFINGEMEKSYYKKGIKNGISIYFWKDGGTEERFYVDGMKSGKAERKFSNGSREEIVYLNGEIHGESTYYYPDGTYKKRVYDTGKIVGKEIMYLLDGNQAVIERPKEEILEFSDMMKEVKEIIVNTLKNEITKILKEELQKEHKILDFKFVQEDLPLKKINKKDNYGRKQGQWLEKNNGLLLNGIYIDNERHGEWILKEKDGEEIAKRNYYNGKLIGEEYFDDYFRERRKWSVDLEGKKQGEWIIDKEDYYSSDNGYQSYQKIRSVIKYVDNMEQGEFISYHRDGSVHEKGNYMNGKREGAYIAFDFKGRIIRKGNYKNGKKNGEWLEKDTVYNYKNDLKIGIYKTYFNDGNIKEINTYLEEGKIKIQELFYKDGQIKSKIKYIFDGKDYVKNNMAVISTSKEKYFYIEYLNGEKIHNEEMNISYNEIEKICKMIF